MKIKITIYDHVHCRIEKEKRYLLNPLLRISYRVWLRGQYKKYPKETDKTFVDRSGLFWSGFLPLVRKFLIENKIRFSIKGSLEVVKPRFAPNLNGITFREDQEHAIKKATNKQRGVIHFPTATGKTVIAAGIISCYRSPYVLFLCRQKSLLMQAKKKFIQYGLNKEEIGIYGAGRKERKRITIATAQSYVKIDPDEYRSVHDIIIVDEAHEVAGSSQYQKILENSLSPIRIGLTATAPTNKIEKMTVTGLLGPVIARLKMSEAIDKKLLAKPIVELEVVKHSRDTQDRCFNYKWAEKYGIVENDHRNRLVLMAAQRSVAMNRSVLIMVRRKLHGRILFMLSRKLGFTGRVRYIWGATDIETRELVQNLLNDKKCNCVIASSIWKQGVDIPSLDHVINAFGGKGDIPTIQVPGRGTRTNQGKKEIVLLTDFLDPYRYLAEHSIRRIQIYREQEWM